MTMLKPLQETKRTLTAAVQEHIRAAIVHGELAPGSRLDQARLAQSLAVSLIPVREALKNLAAEGFVHIVPRRGAFVSEASLSDMEALYAAREILEGQTAYRAAAHLSPEALATLDALMNEMGHALVEHDYAGFSRANRVFHFTIYQAAENPYLLDMIGTLWELAERYRYRYLLFRDQAATIQAEHRAILDACHAHDAARLRDAITDHMHQTLLGVKQYLLQAEKN
jgi:DNA-binding GntR family transcriptional regulator